MRIAFLRPYLLILIPLIIGGLVLSMRFLRTVDKKRRLGQIIFRGLLFTLLIFAVSGVSIMVKDNNVATIFVVDSSDSLKNNQQEISRFVSDALKNKGKKDYVGVVAFGKTAAVENFLSKETAFNGISSTVDGSATNLESAVNLALSMFPEGYAKRIVLISDGQENSGELMDTAADITLSGCQLLTLSLTRKETEEVYIKNLQVPESVGLGESFSIVVEVESNVATDAVISLYLGRSLRGQKPVSVQRGHNTYTFRDTQSDTGLKTYQVTIETPHDTVTLNNEYSAYTNISKQDPVLLVEGTPGIGESLENVFRSLNTPYQKVTPDYVPSTLSELLEYSGVVLVNVNADRLNRSFMEIVETYVKDYGKGLIACGGRQVFAMGGYKGTPLETVLPVEMDVQGEKEIPKMAIQLVIDQSGSMSGENLEMAKQAAVAAADTMRDTDLIGVMSFDDSYSRVVPITEITDRKEIARAISSIDIRGGTSILPALRAAAQDLSKADAAIKHIILLTDGQDGFAMSNYNSLIHAINDESITVSTVAIGAGCNTELLSFLAERCNGRMYQTSIGTDIPRIFTQEVYLSANTYIVEDEFAPIAIQYGSVTDSLITDVAADGLPTLYAYVATTIKPRATEVLVSPKNDPVLAWWQYGLGKTLVWTSDATAEWSGNFFAWDGNPQLWSNMLNLVTQELRVDGSYAEVTQSADGAHVTYHTEDFGAATSVSATVTDVNGNPSIINLPATAPGVFEGDFEMTGTGVYSIAVNQYTGDELMGGVTTAAIKKYSPEYVFDFNDKGNLLEDYTIRTGGTMIESPDMVFSSVLKTGKAMTDITTPLLVVALLLFVFDIAYRRFNVRLIPERKKKAPTSIPVKESVKSPVAEDIVTPPEPVIKPAKVPKAPKAPKQPKQEDKEVLDTSQLLNRMKKQ